MTRYDKGSLAISKGTIVGNTNYNSVGEVREPGKDETNNDSHIPIAQYHG